MDENFQNMDENMGKIPKYGSNMDRKLNFNWKIFIFKQKMLNKLISMQRLQINQLIAIILFLKIFWIIFESKIFWKIFVKIFIQKFFEKIFSKKFFMKIFDQKFHKFGNFNQFLPKFYKKWRNMDKIWKIWTKCQNMEKYGKYGNESPHFWKQTKRKVCFSCVSDPKQFRKKIWISI